MTSVPRKRQSPPTDLALDLARRIRGEGPIPVSDFMTAAVEAYYAQGDIFGRDGDFTTAPEISQVFGELIGLWCAVTWQALGCPRPLQLIECGPGRGTLMKDILRTASETVPDFINSLEIHLVEQSAALRRLQKEALAAYTVSWHDNLADVPSGPMILVANEFLDALPIEQYVKTPSGWCQRLVGLENTGRETDPGFAFETSPLPADKSPPAPLDNGTADGSIWETSPAADETVKEISQRCVNGPGAALIIDYGYTEHGLGDTLQAVSRHNYHPVFDDIGAADLTAHVNFTAVAGTARIAGASVFGPVTQGHWLRQLGATVREAQLTAGRGEADAAAIKSGIRRLIEPEGMGDLFKVIALTDSSSRQLEGFRNPPSC